MNDDPASPSTAPVDPTSRASTAPRCPRAPSPAAAVSGSGKVIIFPARTMSGNQLTWGLLGIAAGCLVIVALVHILREASDD